MVYFRAYSDPLPQMNSMLALPSKNLCKNEFIKLPWIRYSRRKDYGGRDITHKALYFSFEVFAVVEINNIQI